MKVVIFYFFIFFTSMHLSNFHNQCLFSFGLLRTVKLVFQTRLSTSRSVNFKNKTSNVQNQLFLIDRFLTQINIGT